MVGGRVLITGGSGFIASALRSRLNILGIPATILTRSVVKPFERERVIISRLEEEPDQAVFEEVDVVFHTAALVHVMRTSSPDPELFRRINVEGTATLATRSAEAGVRRFIYLSSVKVNGEDSGSRPFVETDSPNPSDAYARSKLSAEEILRQIAASTNLEFAILRLPLVYGPGVKANFRSLINVIKKGVPLPFSSIQNERSLIFVRNLVDAMIFCAQPSVASGETLFVSDDDDVSTPELIRRMALALGRRPRLVPCPPAVLETLAFLLGRYQTVRRLTRSLSVDVGKIRRMGWVPPFTMAEGLGETLGEKNGT